jgi:hypothetical protein
MRKLKIGFIASILLLNIFCYANITTIHSFDEANEQLNNADTSTLVIFDVDDVLITSDDHIFRPSASGFRPSCWKGKNAQELDHLVSIIQSEIDFILIEQDLPSLIDSLQKREVKTIALTACRTGKFGVIESVEDWRINQLLDHSIDFSVSWKDILDTRFPHLVALNQNPPIFKKGILLIGDFYFENGTSTKGQLLGAFFDKIKWHPKKVLFFDDKMKNLTSVQDELAKRGIEYQGFFYRGAESVPGDFDKELAEFQVEYLTKNKTWLKDKEARELFEQKKNLSK